MSDLRPTPRNTSGWHCGHTMAVQTLTKGGIATSVRNGMATGLVRRLDEAALSRHVYALQSTAPPQLPDAVHGTPMRRPMTTPTRAEVGHER